MDIEAHTHSHTEHVYVHECTHTHKQTHSLSFAHTDTHAQKYVVMDARTHTHLHTYMLKRTHALTHTHSYSELVLLCHCKDPSESWLFFITVLLEEIMGFLNRTIGPVGVGRTGRITDWMHASAPSVNS